tara:strand:+ start:1765 stop:2634 length:870 start_codon:yes stop_codon:yes gene_type:complete
MDLTSQPPLPITFDTTNKTQYPFPPPSTFMTSNIVSGMDDPDWERRSWNQTPAHSQGFNANLQHKIMMTAKRPLSAQEFLDEVREFVTEEQYGLAQVQAREQANAASKNVVVSQDTMFAMIKEALDNEQLRTRFVQDYAEDIPKWFGTAGMATQLTTQLATQDTTQDTTQLATQLAAQSEVALEVALEKAQSQIMELKHTNHILEERNEHLQKIMAQQRESEAHNVHATVEKIKKEAVVRLEDVRVQCKKRVQHYKDTLTEYKKKYETYFAWCYHLTKAVARPCKRQRI